ncbi:MAG TPA: YlmH/Sll1252 family protein [Clostridiales bacterium]|nr:YlmH/Sll1252 family protein [Clostridiales bacterium]
MKNQDNTLIKARFDDAVKNAAPGKPCFFGFLDEFQREFLRPAAEKLTRIGTVQVAFWGGYEDAERVMIGIFAEEPDLAMFPIRAVRVEYDKKFGSLSHRDYLGAMTALGIARERIGDILTDEDGATAFCSEAIAQLLKNELKTVGRCGVRVDFAGEKCYNFSHNRERRELIVASARLDAVLAALLHLSRESAVELIAAGKVKVNGAEQTDKSAILREDTVFSILGKGKFRFIGSHVGGRKNKTHAEIEIYD